MEKEAIIACLRMHEAELKGSGIENLALFGSRVRDDAGKQSDVDLVAAFDEAVRLSLLDIIRLERRLSDLIGAPVDLVEETALKPPVREAVAREALRAF